VAVGERRSDLFFFFFDFMLGIVEKTLLKLVMNFRKVKKLPTKIAIKNPMTASASSMKLCISLGRGLGSLTWNPLMLIIFGMSGRGFVYPQ
jgi:hypothetical protein